MTELSNEAITILACAIAAPITAALMRFLPQRQPPNPPDYDDPPVLSSTCANHRRALNNRVSQLETPTNKEPNP